jgi:N-acyl-D-amino-acid deacylase
MRAGALGLGSSLIYAPACFASTEELVALCRTVAEYDGLYATHLRSEGERFLEALEEALAIGRETGVRVEIWHLKAAGESNWPKLEAAIEKIEAARADGQRVAADIYNYTAGATGLSAAFPPWVQEGGYDAWAQRLRDPEVRRRLQAEMNEIAQDWENLYLAAGSGERVLLVGFQNPDLQALTGRSLADVAAERGTNEIETMMDLVLEDGSRVEAIYFLMSRENLERKVALPWVSFCSDEASLAPEGVFLQSNPHPRAYGNFACLFATFVRERGLISLEEAVRRASAMPADHFGLQDRGRIQAGAFADLVIFDPDTIQDHATYADPHQLATGVCDVIVNGVITLREGEPTGRMAGRVLRRAGTSEER